MKRKSLLSLLLIATLLLGICAVFSSCGTMRKVEEDEQGLYYTLNEDGESYSVAAGSKAKSEIVIPATFRDKPVTVIADGAFDRDQYSSSKEFTKISVPDSIEMVGVGAFNGQEETLEFYEQSTTVDGQEVPQYRYLGNETNNHVILICTNESNYRMPEGTKAIYDNAFSEHVETVTISQKLSYISPFAFADLSYYVGEDARKTGISVIDVDEANPNFKDLGNLLLNKDESHLYYCCVTDSMEVNLAMVLPATLTYVEPFAFPRFTFESLKYEEGENVYLASVNNPHFMLVCGYQDKAIDANTKVIAEGALYGLKSVTIPDSVIQIHKGASDYMESATISSKGWFNTHSYAFGRAYDLGRLTYVDGKGMYAKNGEYEKIEEDLSDPAKAASELNGRSRENAMSFYRYE